MKKLLAVAALALALVAPARASTYSVTTDASSTTLKLNGRLHMQTLAGVEQLVIDSVKGVFTWTYGIQASTGSFTATGNSTYSLSTSSGVSVAAGGVTAPWFSGIGSALTGTSSMAVPAGNLTGGPISSAVLPSTVAFTTSANSFTAAQAIPTVSSSMTVQGNAFSVGGSSFTVAGGSVTVAYGLQVGSLNLQNTKAGTQCLHADSSGNITGTGSDCGGASNAVLTATQTFSGANTYTATTTFSGAVIFQNQGSTQTVITGTQNSASPTWVSVTGSTITTTFHGGHLLSGVSCNLSVSVGGDSCYLITTYNGAYPRGGTSTIGAMMKNEPAANDPTSQSFVYLSTFTYTGPVTGVMFFRSAASVGCDINRNSDQACYFWMEEVP